jgi:hypothetical protein
MFNPHRCDNCDGSTLNPEDEYGEFICDDCIQSAAERDYERRCEAFHGGDGPLPLIEQQRQALKFK